jgi:hypothetical protein
LILHQADASCLTYFSLILVSSKERNQRYWGHLHANRCIRCDGVLQVWWTVLLHCRERQIGRSRSPPNLPAGIALSCIYLLVDPSILCDNSCLFNQLVYLILPIIENHNVHSVYASHVLLTWCSVQYDFFFLYKSC